MWNLTKIIGKEKINTYRAPEYKQFLKLRLLSFVIIGILALTAMLGGFFIYRNIFLTIGQAEQIILIEGNLTALEIIDFAKFDKVKKLWEEKNSTLTPAVIRDPFNPAPTSTIP